MRLLVDVCGSMRVLATVRSMRRRRVYAFFARMPRTNRVIILFTPVGRLADRIGSS
jgi:hypothetical protein